jgi:nitrate/nitrite transporter NarK
MDGGGGHGNGAGVVVVVGVVVTVAAVVVPVAVVTVVMVVIAAVVVMCVGRLLVIKTRKNVRRKTTDREPHEKHSASPVRSRLFRFRLSGKSDCSIFVSCL